MHPVTALILLFGPLDRHLSVRAGPIPDGTRLVRRTYQDTRDLDEVAQAGYLSRALLRVRRHPGGDHMAAMLRAYYSRQGVENQGARLAMAIEDLQKQGFCLRGRRGKEATCRLYLRLLDNGLATFASELRQLRDDGS